MDDTIHYDTGYRRTGGEPLTFSSVWARQESSSTQKNYISRGGLLTSQGPAYLTKPSSPCQINGRHPRPSDANIYHGHSQLVWPCKSGCELCTTADSNGHQNLAEPPKALKRLSSQRSAMVSKSATQRNEPAYAQIGLVKASRTSCHRNIVHVTRVYLTAVQMVGESRWPDPDY